MLMYVVRIRNNAFNTKRGTTRLSLLAPVFECVKIPTHRNKKEYLSRSFEKKERKKDCLFSQQQHI
jgi:hypothetical protein